MNCFKHKDKTALMQIGENHCCLQCAQDHYEARVVLNNLSSIDPSPYELCIYNVLIDHKACHENLWNWLADNPFKEDGQSNYKFHSPVIQLIMNLSNLSCYRIVNLSPKSWENHFNHNQCFACIFTIINYHSPTQIQCSHCPVDFNAITCEYSCASYYYKWKYSHTTEERSYYARLIATGWREKT
jgi:hypothetical protein